MAGRPRLLLLDEPAAGLDTDESLALGKRLRDVARTGVSILLIDHDMGLVLNVCDYIYVMEFGQVIAAGTPQEVVGDPRVITAYLGEEGETLIEKGETLGEKVVTR
jgi:branched-chain amino acid transport system ATP-binding protein